MNVSSGYRKYGFDAYGGKYLQKSDMSYWMNNKLRTDPAGIAFELGKEIEEVEPDFFEIVPTINALWIINPKCHIHMTDATVKLFRNNDIVLRGVYDSVAEKLAKEYHLRFLHLDVELASVGDYFERGKDIITLRFYSDGSAYIHQDCRCPGISAGSIGGGENSFDLKKDFYLTMDAKEIANKCWGSCYKEILGNGKLSSIINKAKKKKGFYLDFRNAVN